MSKKLLLALAGCAPATIFAAPVPSQTRGLTPDQVKAGCTLNMSPPFRPECHAAGEQHAVHAGATPDPDPDIDLGCEHNGRVLGECWLRIGHRPKARPIDALGDPTLPSQDSSTTLLPAPFPYNGTRNRTSYDVPLTTGTSNVQTAVSSRPFYSVLFTRLPPLLVHSAGSPPSSVSHTFSLPPASTSHPSEGTTDWSSSLPTPGTTSSEAQPTVSLSRSNTDTTSSSLITSSTVVTSSSRITTSPVATHSSSSSHISSSTSSAAHAMVSSSRPSADTTSTLAITSSPRATHSSSAIVSSGSTSLPSTTRSSGSTLLRPTETSPSRTSSTTMLKQTTSTMHQQSSTTPAMSKKSSTSSSATETASHMSTSLSSKPSTASKTSTAAPSKTMSKQSSASSSATHKAYKTITDISLNSRTASQTSPAASSKLSLISTPIYDTVLPIGRPTNFPTIVVEGPGSKDMGRPESLPTVVVEDPGLEKGRPTKFPTVVVEAPGLPTGRPTDLPYVVVDGPGPNKGKLDDLPTVEIEGPGPKNRSRLDEFPTVVVQGLALKEREEVKKHLTAVIEGLGPEDKDKKHLALGLGIGLSAGIPTIGAVRWLGKIFHTLSTLAKNARVYTSVMRALTTFTMDMIPHFNFRPGGTGGGNPARGGSPASEVAESVDEWYDELCREGNTGEQAAEIINNFKADMAAAEAAMANEPVAVESEVEAAAGKTFSNPSVLQSWAVQGAAQIASTPGADAGEIADALLKAGVPADAVQTTADAVAHSVSTAAKGWIGRPAFNAALGVISSAVTSSGVAASEAAKAAVNGATGPGLAWSLGPAGVPASAADATAQAMTEAIEAAKASGSDPVTAAINVVSKAASPSGLAAAAAFEGASGSSLAPALSAAGVPTDSLGATADAVAAAVSANGGSQTAALNAAADIIASAASPAYARMNSPAPPVSPAQGAFDVVGASFNFWHTIPWLIWDTLNKLEANGSDASDAEGLAKLLEMGPPPDFSSRFPTFPYRRGGNRVTGLPPLPTDALRPTPPSTHNGTYNATQNATHNSTQSLAPTTTPTLKPAPPGTGGYLYDGTNPAPSARG